MSRWIRPRSDAYLSPSATERITAHGLADVERPVVPDPVVEVAPVDELEDQVVPPLVDAAVVDRDDVGMLERLGALGLAEEPLEHRRVLGQASGAGS